MTPTDTRSPIATRLQVIDNPDPVSEAALVAAYAPSVSSKLVAQLTAAFADLRALNEEGLLAYPYSTREIVAVARHLQVQCWNQLHCVYSCPM